MIGYADTELGYQEQVENQEENDRLGDLLKKVGASEALIAVLAPEDRKTSEYQEYLTEILGMIDVYTELPKPALLMVLQERGFKSNSLKELSDIHLIALAIYTHEKMWELGMLLKRLRKTNKHRSGPLMIDLPL